MSNTALASSKRVFLGRAGKAGLLIASGLIAPVATLKLSPAALAREDADQKPQPRELTPPEDLMREHGVLDRILLIYEAGIRKFAANEDFDPAILIASTEILREFIHDYHERSEEEEVFPRFMNAGKMVELVNILLAQHTAGRLVTEGVLKYAPSSRTDGDARRRTVTGMQQFIAMYRPHAAREDTDLFPKLRKLVSPHEYGAMAEAFEQKERKLFGQDGFEKLGERLAALDQQIGIHDLDQFTPRCDSAATASCETAIKQ